MNIAQEIYNVIEKHCGQGNIALRGTTWQSLQNMKNGKANPTLNTISSILKVNGIPAEIVLTVEREGKKGKTKIKL